MLELPFLPVVRVAGPAGRKVASASEVQYAAIRRISGVESRLRERGQLIRQLIHPSALLGGA